jgi:hypothetical protein
MVRKQNGRRHRTSVDFATVNHAALCNVAKLLRQILPNGKYCPGGIYVARNPRRPHRSRDSLWTDAHVLSRDQIIALDGTLIVNIRTGLWTNGDVIGRDLISLVAYVRRRPEIEAAVTLARAFGVATGDA